MAADGFQFAFTPDVEVATAPVWEKVKRHVTPMEWRARAPLIAAINRLKAEKDAVILAHNYMSQEIFHGVGDYVGDSLGLAKEVGDAPERLERMVQQHVALAMDWDRSLSSLDTHTLRVRVNEHVREQGAVAPPLRETSPRRSDEEQVLSAVRGNDRIQQWVAGKQVVKTIYVPGKLVNVVVR